MYCTQTADGLSTELEPPSDERHGAGRKPGLGLEISRVSKEELRSLMRYGVEAAIRGIIAIACEDEDPRNRIRATELLGKYSLGERVEVDQDIAPAIVLMIAEKPGDPGWPSIASVEPLSASDMIPVER